MSGGGWLRLQQDFYDDKRIVQAVFEQGPLAAAAAVFALTESKKQNLAGIAELSALVLARNSNSTLDQANNAITSLVTNGYIEMTDRPDFYFVVDYPKLQPDPRAWGGKTKPAESTGSPGEPQGAPGYVTERHETKKKKPRTRTRPRPTVVPDPPSEEERERTRRMAVVVGQAHRTGQLERVSAALAAHGTDNVDVAKAALEAS